MRNLTLIVPDYVRSINIILGKYANVPEFQSKSILFISKNELPRPI
jgi:hypothetical protein